MIIIIMSLISNSVFPSSHFTNFFTFRSQHSDLRDYMCSRVRSLRFAFTFLLDLHGKIATQKHSPRFVLQHDLLFSSSRSGGAFLTSFSSCGSSYGPPLLLRVNLAVDFEPVRHLPRHLPHVAGVTASSPCP